jgi:hypothetical protein
MAGFITVDIYPPLSAGSCPRSAERSLTMMRTAPAGTPRMRSLPGLPGLPGRAGRREAAEGPQRYLLRFRPEPKIRASQRRRQRPSPGVRNLERQGS